jgi:hypothetical protein
MNEAQHRALTERMDRIAVLLERVVEALETQPVMLSSRLSASASTAPLNDVTDDELAAQQEERNRYSMRVGITAPPKPARKAKKS